jgi:hypothetical protein
MKDYHVSFLQRKNKASVYALTGESQLAPPVQVSDPFLKYLLPNFK